MSRWNGEDLGRLLSGIGWGLLAIPFLWVAFLLVWIALGQHCGGGG